MGVLTVALALPLLALLPNIHTLALFAGESAVGGHPVPVGSALRGSSGSPLGTPGVAVSTHIRLGIGVRVRTVSSLIRVRISLAGGDEGGDETSAGDTTDVSSGHPEVTLLSPSRSPGVLQHEVFGG